jgi:ankyrin repeat protein
LHDCLVEKRHPDGEFGRVVKSLVEAGSPWDAFDYPTGDARLDEVFMEHLPHRIDGAAILGDEDLVSRLLGEHPSAEQLAMALGGAAKGGHEKLCATLLARGADVNGTSGEDRASPLMHAVRGCSAPGARATIELLLRQGADARLANRYATLPLHAAAWAGASVDTVRLLLRAGTPADIGAKNEFGFTPASIAAERGHEEISALFREFSPESNHLS